MRRRDLLKGLAATALSPLLPDIKPALASVGGVVGPQVFVVGEASSGGFVVPVDIARSLITIWGAGGGGGNGPRPVTCGDLIVGREYAITFSAPARDEEQHDAFRKGHWEILAKHMKRGSR